jgi:hypothetical protein
MHNSNPRNRGRGRPKGSKNNPRVREPGAPFTVDEFCKRYGIGRATFYRHVAPKIKLIKIGTRSLISEAEALAFGQR